MALHVTLGNKNYSSWSFRPWIALKVTGIPFAETVIPIYYPGSREKFLALSPAGIAGIEALLARPLAEARDAGLAERSTRDALAVITAAYEYFGNFRLRTLRSA